MGMFKEMGCSKKNSVRRYDVRRYKCLKIWGMQKILLFENMGMFEEMGCSKKNSVWRYDVRRYKCLKSNFVRRNKC